MKITFLILLIICLLTCALYAQPKDKTKPESRAPSQADLESMFGKPVSCNLPNQYCSDKNGKQIKCTEPKGYTCFLSTSFYQRILVKAQFDSSNYAKTINVFDGLNYPAARETAQQIIMLYGRGRFLMKTGDDSAGSGGRDYTEEYEYLSMRITTTGCVNSSPGGVFMAWKK